MAKEITITESAYEWLKALERDDESFSDVIERLAGDDRDIWKGCGKWTDTGLAESAEAEREAFNDDVRERDDTLRRQ